MEPKKPKLEIKNLRTMRGEETPAFTGTLVVDGVRAADLHSAGTGGAVRIDWLTYVHRTGPGALTGAKLARAEKEAAAAEAARAKFEAHVAALPDRAFPPNLGGGTYRPDADTVLFGLVESIAAEKRVRRDLATKTVFRTPDDKPGEYRIYKRACDDRMRAHIAAQYPGAVILNDLVAKGGEVGPEWTGAEE